MALLPKALCIFGAVLVISLQLSNGSAIPRLCRCVNTIGFFHLSKVKDFSIQERGDGCRTEILLTTDNPDVPEICLNPETPQGKRLLGCWKKRIQEDESRKLECLHRGKK